MIRRLLRPPVVLVYHGVAEAPAADDPVRLLTPPRNLDAHIRLLRAHRYEFRTAAGLTDGGPPSAGVAALTFDDGWANWCTTALPVLTAHGISATFYVCPGLWGQQHPDLPSTPEGRLLGREDAIELHAAGMELGAHSLTHPDLRKLPDRELEREVRGSKEAVEELTGRACETFAYPFGFHDRRVERAVESAGFRLGFAWLPGPWRQFAAPRLPAPSRRGRAGLALKIHGVRRRWGR